MTQQEEVMPLTDYAGVRFKWVLTWSPPERKARLFRIMWMRGRVGDGNGGYSAKLSLAICLRPSNILNFSRGPFEWRLSLLGLHVHLQKAYGGIHV